MDFNLQIDENYDIELSIECGVDFALDEAQYITSSSNVYKGAYSVTPATTQTTLMTSGFNMTDNIIVFPVPYREQSLSGGTAIYIGV